MNADQFEVEWHDSGREPQCQPDPRYPNGIDVVLPFAQAGAQHCIAPLPYPARRCGHYEVVCKLCGSSLGLTTAGRPDDPKSVTVQCRLTANGALQ